MSENNSSLTYPVFKMLSTQNDIETRKKGRPVYDDQEVCEIRFSGNKQTVGVFPAHEMCEWADDPLTQERTRITYAQKFNEQYMRFKNGEAQAAHGTPLEELAFLTQGKRLELKALNIHTAEALAALDGNPLKMLGMNGRELKTQAQLYLDSATRQNDAMSIAAENARLKKRLAELEGKSNTPKKGSTPKKTEKVAEEAAEADGSGGDEADKPAETENPFSDWDAEDLAAWIVDAEPGYEIDGRWGRETLAEKAKELNDKIAAAKAKS